MKIIEICIWTCCIALLDGRALDNQENGIILPSDLDDPIIQDSPTTGLSVNTFYNVIFQSGADPWVYLHTDGFYYVTRTTGGNVQLWRSCSFTSIDAGDTISLWVPSGTDPACSNIWAPEIHFINSAWYVYFSATTCDGNNNNHRMFVLKNNNADPFTGSFTFQGQIYDSTNLWAIDGTVFQHPSGQLYMIWSGWATINPTPQYLYIAQMSDPLTISSERVLISSPTNSWEQSGGAAINEGPEVIIRNNVISLVYSAAASWTNDYCLGLISASTTSDPMDPASWTKRSNPIFRSTINVFGPGHHSFTTSPDGQEDWIIYHSARYNNSGWIRQVRAQRFTWGGDSTPLIGKPANPNTPMQIPSSDQVRLRYEAENAVLMNYPTVIIDSTASNVMKVGNMSYGNSTITFTIPCAIAGTYAIAIRDANGSTGSATATQWLTVNNGSPIQISIVNSGWDRWGASYVRVNLKLGVNTLTFTTGNNYAELDAIDVFLYK